MCEKEDVRFVDDDYNFNSECNEPKKDFRFVDDDYNFNSECHKSNSKQWEDMGFWKER